MPSNKFNEYYIRLYSFDFNYLCDFNDGGSIKAEDSIMGASNSNLPLQIIINSNKLK